MAVARAELVLLAIDPVVKRTLEDQGRLVDLEREARIDDRSRLEVAAATDYRSEGSKRPSVRRIR